MTKKGRCGCRALEALAGLEMFFRREGEDAGDAFERIADVFFRETGFMRPGKSQPFEMTASDEERERAYSEWLAAKLRLAREQLGEESGT